ncbi:ATP-binding protein [Maridesulfovibrio frigidus]|uniref:ATP-binding protein n=1 Tax=Maridesulfovibrio frigidus TaxID=340956 RepID=UPI0004E1BC32|nr:ATP-binding protein [Maridesulfovibrio frigidus]
MSFEQLDSEKDTAARIAQGIYSAIASKETILEKAAKWAKDTLTSYSPSMQINPDGTPSFSAVSIGGIGGRALLEQVLKDLNAMAEKMDNRVIIAFDEFQEVSRLKGSDGIEGLLRTQIQFQEFSHIFIGSRRAVLKQMFEDPKRSFFKSAIMKTLQPLPTVDLVQYYIDLFASAEKKCPSNISTGLAELSHGYGFYAQQYGYFAFGASERVADSSSFNEAAQAVLEQAKSGFEILLSTMTANQIKLLKALAIDPTQALTAGEYCMKHEMISSNVAYARNSLVEQDHIEKDNEGWWRVVDPVFRLWLQN